MGSLPQLSIVKGAQKYNRPRLLHKVFEEKVDKEFGEKTALIFNGKWDKTPLNPFPILTLTSIFQIKMAKRERPTTTH